MRTLQPARQGVAHWEQRRNAEKARKSCTLSFAKILSPDWTMTQRCANQEAMSLVIAPLGALRAALRTRTDLALGNLALRQQLVLLRAAQRCPANAASSC